MGSGVSVGTGWVAVLVGDFTWVEVGVVRMGVGVSTDEQAVMIKEREKIKSTVYLRIFPPDPIIYRFLSSIVIIALC